MAPQFEPSKRIADEQLLGEVEALLREMPPLAELNSTAPAVLAWFGRASAIVRAWDHIAVHLFLQQISFHRSQPNAEHVGNIISTLHEVRFGLRMRTSGPVNVAIGSGGKFDYFEVLREVIETGGDDLLFIDPYLDADFVGKYLPHVKTGTKVRLLTTKKDPRKLATLLPAVAAFHAQWATVIDVRLTNGIHDRYLIVDGRNCYQSGASFKDGGQAPTTLTQITDAFPGVKQTYEDLWAAAEPTT